MHKQSKLIKTIEIFGIFAIFLGFNFKIKMRKNRKTFKNR